MKPLQRAATTAALALAAVLGSGCTTAIVIAHAHSVLTESDPTPCIRLNSVDRALRTRCAPFETGSLRAEDIAASGLPQCPLTLAARDPVFWPVLPELIAKGAQPEHCTQAPLVALAARHPCPAFDAATQAERQALRWLAQADARAIHHDVMRLFSCPSAREAGLATVLDDWLALGLLPAGELAFSPLGALHPSHLSSPLARALEAQGHTARAAFGGQAARLAGGYEEALRQADWYALDWWMARLPELADRVPAMQGNQLPWVPLARVLTPAFVADPAQQRALVDYLLARGADPWKRLPHDPSLSVVGWAHRLGSPLAPLLDQPTRVAQPKALQAVDATALSTAAVAAPAAR